MKQNPSFEKIQSLICHHLGVLPERIGPHTELKKIGANDLDLIELCIAVEKEFRLSLEETTTPFTCANDILRALGRAGK